MSAPSATLIALVGIRSELGYLREHVEQARIGRQSRARRPLDHGIGCTIYLTATEFAKFA